MPSVLGWGVPLWDDELVEAEGEVGRGLHLGFTNATAFSPTDVGPLTRRAKYAMLLQSTVALALFGLVVARAVNAFK
jgi:hypothetical protein